MTYKYSRQREAILEYMKDRKDHPTADMVYEEVRGVYPNISLGTVYRNLTLLKEMGKLQMIDVGDSAVHFDPNTEEHCHFLCAECGCVLDVEGADLTRITSGAEKNFPGRIDGCRAYFYGVCEKCLQKKEQ